MAHLLYGSGLRVTECMTLRVKDVDLGAGLIRQGGERRQGPNHVAATPTRASAAATTTEGCRLAQARPRTGCGIRSSAKCFGTQVSKCKPGFGLAIPVPLSRHTELPLHRAPPSLACLRVWRTDGLQSSTASSRYCQTCVMPHATAFVCDSLACGRHRHPDDPTAPGASGPEDHHDLHPCRAGDPDNRQPTRPTTHLLNTPGGHRFDVRYGSHDALRPRADMPLMLAAYENEGDSKSRVHKNLHKLCLC